MPIYQYRNHQTKQIEEHMVRIAEADQFLEDNPHLKRVPVAPKLGQRINLRSQISDGFKDVLNKAKDAHPLGDVHV